MKLNWAERWVVNNPLRVVQQRMELRKLRTMQFLKPGFTALEIGCGRGAGAGQILDIFQPSRVYATDLDIEMVEKAKAYLPPEKHKTIFLVTADGYQLPVKTASVDAVFDFGVLHHIPDWRSALAEIERVLKPGGTFFLEELYPTLYQNFLTKHVLLHPTENRFSSREFKEALTGVGLPLKDYMELKSAGILGVAVKT
jgi:ubiquinone/menaquinone biosynthesis C-methylase UbiE